MVAFLRSAYHAPWGFSHGDLQTVYPTLFRRLPLLPYRRETLTTTDGDFLDLDWLLQGDARKRPLAILAHGMEGTSQAIYIRGVALCLAQAGFDILAWNMRGCGGRPNRKRHFYHSGKTDDLRAVIVRALKSHARYALVGFSLGGNVVLKHLGEIGQSGEYRHTPLIGAAAISVPIDLQACADRLSQFRNFIYEKRFLLSFQSKVKAKMRAEPGRYAFPSFQGIRSIRDFDNAFTAPDFGYENAETYWAANASLHFLPHIQSPTLMLSSVDDPILSPTSHPSALAEKHEHLIFEQSLQGGHCGFMAFNASRTYYSEARVRDFFLERV